MKKLISIFLLPLLIACNSTPDLQSLIDQAIAAGETELFIPAGTYVIQEPIRLEGVEDFHLHGDTADRTYIISALELNIGDFELIDSTQGLYEIQLDELIGPDWPDVFRGYVGWPELFVGGIPMTLARYPNAKYLSADAVLEPGSIPRQGDTTKYKPAFSSKELRDFLVENDLANLNPEELSLYLNGYWKYEWYDEVLRVDSFDLDKAEFRLAAPHHYGVGAPSGGQFYLVNHPAAVDHVEEYSIDSRTGTIRAIFPKWVNESRTISIAYKAFNLMELKDCKEVTISGLVMGHHAGNGIIAENSEDILLVNCRLDGIAGNGIVFQGGSSCTAKNLSVTNIGGLGISLQGGDRQTLTKANHLVTRCYISDFARHIKTYAPGIKLEGVGHTVSYNSISNGPHNAILFSGNDHLIANNHIKHVCLNTSDAGAIYCGRDWTMGGTVIKENSIQELGQASHHHNWAIYLDDLASGIEVIGNIIVDCPSGILVGGGRYNRIEKNRLRNCPKASIMYDARGLGWASFFVNDPENIMWQRMDSLVIDQAPWKDRFPWLMELKEDDPAVPKHNVIKNNELFHVADPQIHPSVREFGEVDL